MSNSIYQIPEITNEPILDYAPGSAERSKVLSTIKEFKKNELEVPMVINGQEVFTGEKVRMSPPHEIGHTLGYFHKGKAEHVNQAISAALGAKEMWENMPWQDRAAIFLRAADLISGPRRAHINAVTMLAQSKTVYQAEIDAIAELADFIRFNVKFMKDIYEQQPVSSKNLWNSMEYRALEGFVFAITPFNFTAIAGNLPATPALLGNTVVWKPAESQIYSAIAVMNIFREAGLPDGVINLVYVDGPTAGNAVFSHRDFAGLHFTGSTGVFKHLWKTIGSNIDIYRSYPRIVGETGGKDFVVAHPSANATQVATGLSRGAFEFQGQKCSAASRAYIPKSLWTDVKKILLEQVASFKMGSVEDLSNFISAVIDEKAFDNIKGYIDQVKKDKDAEILIGGKCDKTKGYFIEPTVVQVKDPKYLTMCEEIFGPVLSIYVYEDSQFEEILKVVDSTSPYALTGSIFAQDRSAIIKARHALRHSAGNFYINDKPTGAVVGQQPFGGARGSGTNDKAGSVLNLYRWISPRTIKENFVPAEDYRYPFMG
jgi:1-pyrroline-5-carboxylate dehydrogenase